MSIEAMKQAYEVPLVEQLESVPNNARLVIDDADGMGTRYIPVGRMCHDASKALRQAIAEAEKQEPVAWLKVNEDSWTISLDAEPDHIPLYTTPQQRIWVGLTDEDDINWDGTGNLKQLVEAVEAKLKEKNT